MREDILTGFCMQAHERIETDRLIIRRPRARDAAAVFERYARDPAVTRYLSWPTHRSVSETRAFLHFSEMEWQRWPAGPYLITSRADGTILGGAGFGFETARRAATGYVLARDAWGRGYATEALTAMVDTARRLGVVRLYALCHIDHGASAHVLEKCGFAREGTLRQYTEFPNLAPGALSDVFCYAIVLGR
jgi:ribosomal-protein-alanine N-acetyltransferase